MPLHRPAHVALGWREPCSLAPYHAVLFKQTEQNYRYTGRKIRDLTLLLFNIDHHPLNAHVGKGNGLFPESLLISLTSAAHGEHFVNTGKHSVRPSVPRDRVEKGPRGALKQRPCCKQVCGRGDSERRGEGTPAPTRD